VTSLLQQASAALSGFTKDEGSMPLRTTTPCITYSTELRIELVLTHDKYLGLARWRDEMAWPLMNSRWRQTRY
jgi:hypothetical protein